MRPPKLVNDTPAFDQSRAGGQLAAERLDEPGNEEVWRKVEELDAGHTRGGKVADPMANKVGDWSWKPDRYHQDPGYVFTAADIEALYPGREYTRSPA